MANGGLRALLHDSALRRIPGDPRSSRRDRSRRPRARDRRGLARQGTVASSTAVYPRAEELSDTLEEPLRLLDDADRAPCEVGEHIFCHLFERHPKERLGHVAEVWHLSLIHISEPTRQA